MRAGTARRLRPHAHLRENKKVAIDLHLVIRALRMLQTCSRSLGFEKASVQLTILQQATLTNTLLVHRERLNLDLQWQFWKV